jgi:hypothetical protein
MSNKELIKSDPKLAFQFDTGTKIENVELDIYSLEEDGDYSDILTYVTWLEEQLTGSVNPRTP